MNIELQANEKKKCEKIIWISSKFQRLKSLTSIWEGFEMIATVSSMTSAMAA